MRTRAIVVSVLLLAGCATFSLDTAPQRILQMRSPAGVCTTWAVSPSRWMTAKHCLQMATDWEIGGQAVAVVALDPVFDIALVSGPTGSAFIRIADKPPPIGATVQTLGYGMGEDDLLSFDAVVLAHDSAFFDNSRDFLVSGANGMPGMSGGPILYRGRAVSIITGGGQATSHAHLIGAGVPWAGLSAFARLHLGR